ncbi:hypothetical protein D3C87_238530 [compost metagenome]|uniref:hypothetical protein n=1 Tax=Pedobacter sp. ok626 TaxID=1761882 RepID=UPI0008880282|nr:hypothetical protein [Pedobacter sp. ok626]SDK51368.1 hypothetical protein SAMN04487898_10929 [Pedobacter sp. ok626]
MKTKTNEGKRHNFPKTRVNGTPSYYFHADEDFKEDWDWAKEKTIELKPLARKKKSI